jgi:hypothetical protein
MNMILKFVISLGLVLLATPVISGQDLSRYRNFVLGASLDTTRGRDSKVAGRWYDCSGC